MKKDGLIFACLLVMAALLFFGICNGKRESGMEAFSVDSVTKEEITDELVIALFIDDITARVTEFYSEYYSAEIAVYNYEVSVMDVGKEEPGFISVRFGVTPQVGAHNPLGYDELDYHVDSNGDKELAGYEHLKDYEVPEQFRGYIIKPSE